MGDASNVLVTWAKNPKPESQGQRRLGIRAGYPGIPVCSKTPTELTKLALQSSELEVFQQGGYRGIEVSGCTNTRATYRAKPCQLARFLLAGNKELRRLLATSLRDLRQIRSNASECQPSF
ncbi:hypothetical protein K0M31_015908 [Melipona bicolor]|uniref:Uncharacterized protein n=1 Tax=Melipona bicolor TaxID=60889 RepID=A0AA40G6S4_9HYME|nr:hypothetical protein K0M31_015908 [Melipona bicolor]